MEMERFIADAVGDGKLFRAVTALAPLFLTIGLVRLGIAAVGSALSGSKKAIRPKKERMGRLDDSVVEEVAHGARRLHGLRGWN